jgi:hypothetical protein
MQPRNVPEVIRGDLNSSRSSSSGSRQARQQEEAGGGTCRGAELDSSWLGVSSCLRCSSPQVICCIPLDTTDTRATHAPSAFTVTSDTLLHVCTPAVSLLRRALLGARIAAATWGPARRHLTATTKARRRRKLNRQRSADANRVLLTLVKSCCRGQQSHCGGLYALCRVSAKFKEAVARGHWWHWRREHHWCDYALQACMCAPVPGWSRDKC